VKTSTHETRNASSRQLCDHVRADKLLMFTQRVVLKIVVPKTGKGQAEGTNESERLAEEAADAIDANASPDPTGAPLKYNTARGYISAVLDLYNRQIALKLHNNPNPRGITAFLLLASPPSYCPSSGPMPAPTAIESLAEQPPTYHMSRPITKYQSCGRSGQKAVGGSCRWRPWIVLGIPSGEGGSRMASGTSGRVALSIP
jgi:hypothetical protein